jgi:hypothetical protein
MKNLSIIKIVPLIAAFVVFISCNSKDEKKEVEARNKAEVGKIYNPDEQGNVHENHKNQFPSSRNNNSETLPAAVSSTKVDSTAIDNTATKAPKK